MPQDRAQRPDENPGAGPSSGERGAPTPASDARGVGTYFLGRYRIVDEIGIGGMASVHLARMDGPGGFQKWVAVKKIHAHLVEDESFVQMFLDEARVAARISHPNVATVFDLGKHEDTYWIAMEYLHGEPLRDVMRRTEELGTAMPPEIACRVIADAAEGLHAAHELQGKNGEKLELVHRDVTPHNLFVTYDGVTKVVDFGIAKFSSRMSSTRAGTLKGKLAYMSPEQVHGEGIDRRTDIFALGVVLWELTTGQRLFRMDNDFDTLAKVQECNVPPPSSLIRGYPVDLEKIVMKALSKNRAERFRTARELSRALQSLLMRRGLFIAADEVASYTQSVFADRIQKREAHLRWAAEVTQTINIDQLMSKPSLDEHSEVQAAPGGVRPAAGMPANASASVPTSPGAKSAKGALPKVEAPRPAAGMPAVTPPAGPAKARPASIPDAHPADGDGPTIQADPPFIEEDSAAHDLREAIRGETEPPTVNVGPNSRGSLLGVPRSKVPSNAAIGSFEPEELDDQNETQVVPSRADALPTGPAVPPPPSPFGPQAALPLIGSPFPSMMGPGPSSGYPRAPTGEVPYAAQGMPYGGQPMAPPPYYTPGMTGEFHAGHPHMTGMGPRVAPPTVVVASVKRRPPVWVIAALSCSIALLIAGVAIAFLTLNAPSPAKPSNAIPSAAPSAQPATTAASPAAPVETAPVEAAPAVATPEPAAPAPSDAPAAADVPADKKPEVAASTPAIATPKPAQTAAAVPAPVAKPNPVPAATPAPAPTPVVLPKKTEGRPGSITVVCMPKCDQIVDNGTPLGPGHIFNRSVPSGRHVLQLSAPNGVKKNLVIEVAPDQLKEVRISM